MDAAACAVAHLELGGPWVGFVPTLDDGYALVAGTSDGLRRTPAAPLDLVALAVVYFEDSLPEPPEDLAATLGDIAAVVRHAAERMTDAAARARAQEAVDAIDDGLAADVVLERLAGAVALGASVTAEAHLRRRVASLGA